MYLGTLKAAEGQPFQTATQKWEHIWIPVLEMKSIASRHYESATETTS